MPKKRDASPEREKTGKKTKSDGSGKSKRRDYELFALRPRETGVMISPKPVSSKKKGRIVFEGLGYDIVGEGLNYDASLVDSETFELREKGALDKVRSFDFSSIVLTDARYWNLRKEPKKKGRNGYDSESSYSDGDEGFEETSPEEFESKIARDAAGKKSNTAVIESGAWTFEIHCTRFNVTEAEVGKEEYETLKKYGYKKVVFLLKTVIIDLSNPRDDIEDSYSE